MNFNKYGKMWMKKMFIEGNQIHDFISSSGSGTVINYGSGSDFLQVTVPVTVPVPLVKELRFLRFRFRFRFHNTDFKNVWVPVVKQNTGRVKQWKWTRATM